jgi:2-methylcitrate dehydratase
MSKPAAAGVKQPDAIQSQLSSYAAQLRYEDLDAATIHAAKVRVIDTLAAHRGFFGEGDKICGAMALARAKLMVLRVADGGSITGRGAVAVTRATPVFGVANANARAVGIWFVDVLATKFTCGCRTPYARLIRLRQLRCMGAALGAGKLLGLSPHQLAECLSMAVVPNNALNQARTGHLSMWKAVAAGQSGRGGVFAALLAQAGMKGPHAPFEGKAGWCNHVARKSFTLETFGGRGTPFKILDTLIKPRASCATTISSILAAEKAAANIARVDDIEKVTVEVYERAKTGMGTGEHHWNPDSRETADHSIPYVVAASLIDKRLTPSSFGDARLWSPELRSLLPRIEVVTNAEFTAAYERVPVEHRTRVTVTLRGGKCTVGEAGGDKGDLSQAKTDAEIEDKFRALTEGVLGSKRVDAVLDALWKLDTAEDVSRIPPMLAFA